MPGRTLQSIMAGIDHANSPKPALLQNSTAEYFRLNGNRVIRLHTTDILEFSRFGSSITIKTGGWFSMTARDRINDHTPNWLRIDGKLGRNGKAGGPWYVHRSDELWCEGRPFIEGMTITDGKLPTDKPLLAKAINNGIARFAKWFVVEPLDPDIPRQFLANDRSSRHELGFIVSFHSQNVSHAHGAFPYGFLDAAATALTSEQRASFRLGRRDEQFLAQLRRDIRAGLKLKYAHLYEGSRGNG